MKAIILVAGDGAGDGYGAGYGDGDGNGAGNGDGFGDGYVAGNGDGDGSWYGAGDGFGSGFRDGAGAGDGYGDEIGNLDGHPVCALSPWPYIRIGCEVHLIATWRDRWREIARAHGVVVSAEQAAELLSGAAAAERVRQ